MDKVINKIKHITPYGELLLNPVDMDEVRQVSAKWSDPPPKPPTKRRKRLKFGEEDKVKEIAKQNRITYDEAEVIFLDSLESEEDKNDQSYKLEMAIYNGTTKHDQLVYMIWMCNGVHDIEVNATILSRILSNNQQKALLYKAIQRISELTDWLLLEHIEKLDQKWMNTNIVQHYRDGRIKGVSGVSGSLIGSCKRLLSEEPQMLLKFDDMTPDQQARVIAPRYAASWIYHLKKESEKEVL